MPNTLVLLVLHSTNQLFEKLSCDFYLHGKTGMRNPVSFPGSLVGVFIPVVPHDAMLIQS